MRVRDEVTAHDIAPSRIYEILCNHASRTKGIKVPLTYLAEFTLVAQLAGRASRAGYSIRKNFFLDYAGK